MAIQYGIATINARLLVVRDAIDAGGGNGNLILLAGPTIISTVALARPCGTVSAGVLTFSGLPLIDPSATATGSVTTARIEDSVGNTVVSNFSVGIPLSGADIIMSNGLNSTLITAGQTVSVLSATITGS